MTTLHVLLVLWMMSRFHVMEPLGQNQRQRHVWSSSLGGGTGGDFRAKLMSKIAGLLNL